MSELTTPIKIEIPGIGTIESADLYLKFEADKVIANRDYEIEKLKNSLDTLLKANTEQIIHEVVQKTLIYGEGFIRVEDAMKLIAELRHSKNKQCLAMARWCRSRACFYDTMREGSLYWAWKSDKAYRWHKRWLELAEKLKEGK